MKSNDSFVAENDEILAVISAAIASFDIQPGYKLVVKSLKRIPQYSPVWNTTGRIERIGKSFNN